MRNILPLFCLLSVLLPHGVGAQGTTAFTYQGRLEDGGQPAQGGYVLRFQRYDAASAGAAVGDALESGVVNVEDGLVTVLLDWGSDVVGGGDVWMGIEVRTNSVDAAFASLEPRVLLTPSPRALTADRASASTEADHAVLADRASVADSAVLAERATGADQADVSDRALTADVADGVSAGVVTGEGVATGTLLSSHLAEGQVVLSLNGLKDDVVLQAGTNMVIESAAPSVLTLHSLGWGLGGNAGTDSSVQYLGTSDEEALELRVNAIRALRLERSTNNGGLVNIIAGHEGNLVLNQSSGVVIAGGGANYGTVEGDRSHRVASSSTVVGGGMANRIYTNAPFAVISGGMSNSVADWAFESVIGGGRLNVIETDADHGVIAGGLNQTIGANSYFSTISGGWTNQVLSYYSTIGGGVENYVGTFSQFSTISGGGQNRVEDGSITGTIAGGGNNVIHGNSRRSTISGGKSNEIDSGSPHSVIGGGLANYIGINSEGAVIPGGISNWVEGAYGYAAGRLAEAVHQGAFVWSDSQPYSFVSAAPNEMAVRATGGVRLVSAVDGAGSPLAGVSLAPGSGSWATLSDREAKTGFGEVDPAWVLEQVNRMPVQSWRYRGEGEAVRHIGPTAQDFSEAFSLGQGDRTIATVDADGVALAAIQGLYQLVREQQEEIRQLREQLADLDGTTRRKDAPLPAATSAGRVSE
ncbi:MAG: hypothetical protein RI897_985 [Verrucomicrobiota bacterium]